MSCLWVSNRMEPSSLLAPGLMQLKTCKHCLFLFLPHLKAPSFPFRYPPSPPAPGDLLKAQLRLCCSPGEQPINPSCWEQDTGAGSICIFDLQAEPRRLQARRDLGVAFTSCPHREIQGRERVGMLLPHPLGPELLGRFLGASQVSCWVQITVSNVAVGDKPSNIWGGQTVPTPS